MPLLDVTDRDGRRHRLEARAGDSVMEVLRDAGLPIEAACGGCCVCATCHVYLAPESFARTGARNAGEAALLASCTHFDAASSRLGCQVVLGADAGELALRLAPEE